MPPPIPTRIGRYEVVDWLGAGGMGVVYLATDPLLRRTVAIKVLPVHDEDLRERFQREARSAAALRHPNVVTIYDIGDDDGKAFITMEFLDGESMAEMVRRRAPISIDRRLQLLLELCAGLGYAHKNGIVHRDIKPGNLMVTAEGSLKILDFGLARFTSEVTSTGLTQVGSVLGTPHYMSPEQVEGKVADARSDIFSVGVVLYELLSYQKAYPGDSAHVVLHNIVHLVPTPIRELLPSITPELEALVNKGLEKDPAKRYQSLSSLAADVVRVRSSMTAGAEFETLISPPADAARARSKTSKTPEPTPGRGTRHLASLDAIAQRRAAQVEAFLQVAEGHFAAGRFQETIEACENAVLLDDEDQRALQLLAQAQAGLEDRQIEQCLAEARAFLSSGDLTKASALIEQSLKLRSDSLEAQELQRQVNEQRRERERVAERARSAQVAVERAQRSFDNGAFEAALRSASEALAYDEENQDALSIRQRATAVLEERQREQERDAQARGLVAQARTVMAADPAAAALLLQGFGSPHPLVDEALVEVNATIESLDRQRREEEERQRQLQAELEKRQKRARTYKASARDALKTGRLADALASVESARNELPDDPELGALASSVHEAQEAADAAARTRELIAQRVTASRTALERGDLAAASIAVQAGLEISGNDRELLEIRDAIQATEQRLLREREELAARVRQEAEAKAAEEQRRELEQLEAQQRTEKELRARTEAEARRQTREADTARRAEAKRQTEEAVRRKREALAQAADEARRAEEARRAAVPEADEAFDPSNEPTTLLPIDPSGKRSGAKALGSVRAPMPQPELPREQSPPPPEIVHPIQLPVANKVPSTIKPLWIGVAAGLVLIVGMGLWLSTRSGPANPQAEPVPVPVAAEPAPPVSYQATIQNARQRYSALDIDGAVSLALSVPESAPERAEALQLLGTMRSDAATRAASERQSAQAAPTFDEELVQQGAAKVDEAVKLSQPPDTARAVSIYEEAITLFRQAPVAGWSADRLVNEAKKQYAAKKRGPAIDYALQALTRTPDHAGAAELLQSMKNDAAATVANANRRARTAGLSEANSAGFREGRAKETAARALRAPAETKDALNLYEAAVAAYGTASIEVQPIAAPPQPAPAPGPPPTPAPAPAPTPASLAQGHLRRAEERLAAGDLTAANNALREAEKLDPNSPRLAELKKLADARRPGAVAPPPKPGEIEKLISDSVRMRNDVDAIKFLTEQQARYPGNADINSALGNRMQARDSRIAELVQRSRGANDDKAVEFLDTALALNPARTDVRDERERRARAITRVRTEKSVRDVLDKFESAFEARSVAQFLNIATYRTAMDIEQEFQAYRSIRMDIEGIAITVPQEGGATVRCTIRMVREPAGIRGKTITDTHPWQMKLAETGGVWRITEAAPAR